MDAERSESGSFLDLFSAQAAVYARARPRYPRGLFEFLAGLVPERRLAWDCGTGNGQAAVDLAEHFERVIATDGSPAQLAQARPHARVEYRVMLAEQCDLEPASVDLITVATDLHWFDVERFYAAVRRVLRPGGSLAAWCIGLHQVNDAVDAVCRKFYYETIGPYWHDRRRWVDERYATVPFPFDELQQVPTFECRRDWTLAELMDYLDSWSAVERFKRARGYSPLQEIAGDLSAAWGRPDERRTVTWPIYLRVGTVGSSARG